MQSKIYRFLKWTERYTKTDMIYIGENGFWLGVGQIVGIISSFTLSILLANFVDPNTYGIYKYIFSTAALLSAFTLTGMNTTVIRAVAQGRDSMFKKSIKIQLKWSLLYFLFSLFLAVYYLYNENIAYAISFIIVAIFGPLSNTMNTYQAFLRGKKMFRTSTMYSNITTLVYFLVTVYVIFFAPSAIWLVCAYFVVNGLVNTFFCFFIQKKYPTTNSEIDMSDISYTKHQSLTNILNSMAQQTDNIIIYHLLGPVQLAIYSFAVLIPDRLRALFTSLTPLALPKLAENKHKTWDSIRRKTKQLLLIASVIMVFYLLLAPFGYKLFFSNYLSSLPYSQVYVLSLILLPSYILIPTLWANYEKKSLYILHVTLPFFKIILSIVCIFLYGIWGAIFVKLLYSVVYLQVSYLFAHESIEKIKH